MDTLTTEQLITYYQNAAKTYCNCAGHSKSAMNEQRCQQYSAEMTRRGIDVPELFSAAAAGKFNGKGSY